MIRTLLIPAIAVAALAACSQAEEPAAVDAATMSDPAAATTPVPEYVEQAAQGDLYEIESSRLALTKATRPDIKAFAQKIIDDHTRGSAEMKAALPKAAPGVTPPAALDARHQALVDALQAASGPEFDRLYLSQQATAHEEALRLHEGFSQAAEPAPLVEHARKTTGVIRGHIDHIGRLQAGA